VQGLPPCQISVSSNHAVRCTVLERFFWVEGGINSAVLDEGAALLGKTADCIAAQRIPGMIPMPTTSPGSTLLTSRCRTVSSQRTGVPNGEG
jgi:hypothetical protein